MREPISFGNDADSAGKDLVDARRTVYGEWRKAGRGNRPFDCRRWRSNAGNFSVPSIPPSTIPTSTRLRALDVRVALPEIGDRGSQATPAPFAGIARPGQRRLATLHHTARAWLSDIATEPVGACVRATSDRHDDPALQRWRRRTSGKTHASLTTDWVLQLLLGTHNLEGASGSRRPWDSDDDCGSPVESLSWGNGGDLSRLQSDHLEPANVTRVCQARCPGPRVRTARTDGPAGRLWVARGPREDRMQGGQTYRKHASGSGAPGAGRGVR
jgi:hypothetical protein